MQKSLSPGNCVAATQLYASELIDGTTIVEELIFRDKADIVYDSLLSSRRRRPKWSTTDANTYNYLLTSSDPLPPTSVRESAKVVIDNELAKCDPRGDLKPDLRIYDESFVKSPNCIGVPVVSLRFGVFLSCW